MLGAIQSFDFYILDFIAQHLKCAFLDSVMPFITHLADGGWFWIALALVLLIPKKTRTAGIAMAIALLCGVLTANVTLKPLIARVRPYDINTAVELLITAPTDFSFPSGHTLASFEGAVTLLLYKRSWGVAALILAAAIAFSRLYLYVHYPTDVFASIILGVLFALLGKWAADKIVGYYHKKAVDK